VISGPILLQQAALDAVKQWVYWPFFMDGEPVEVSTKINVIFNLGD
jgi:periplasmic protein TonB